MTPDQAVKVLDELRLLLGADSAGQNPLPNSPGATDQARTDKGSQTSPTLTRRHAPGQTASFDSANSHQGRQNPGTASTPDVQSPAPPAQQEVPAGPVSRAAPPPPSHADHALDDQPLQAPAPPPASDSAPSSLSVQASHQEEPVRPFPYSRPSSIDSQHSPKPSRPRSRVSPCDTERWQSPSEREASPIQKRHTSEDHRFSDWAGDQMRQSGKDLTGRPLSDFTYSELGALQVHDRGKQGPQLGVRRSHTLDSQREGSHRVQKGRRLTLHQKQLGGPRGPQLSHHSV